MVLTGLLFVAERKTLFKSEGCIFNWLLTHSLHRLNELRFYLASLTSVQPIWKRVEKVGNWSLKGDQLPNSGGSPDALTDALDELNSIQWWKDFFSSVQLDECVRFIAWDTKWICLDCNGCTLGLTKPEFNVCIMFNIWNSNVTQWMTRFNLVWVHGQWLSFVKAEVTSNSMKFRYINNDSRQ